MNLRHQQSAEQLAGVMRSTLQDPTQPPPYDTLDRALWRAEVILAGFYDKRQGADLEQCLGDLMTDIMHWCHANQVDLFEGADRGAFMVEQERKDWGLPPMPGAGG